MVSFDHSTYARLPSMNHAGGWFQVASRLTTYILPFLQLVAVYPRPPTEWEIKLFMVVYLLGGPIRIEPDLLLGLRRLKLHTEYWDSLSTEDAPIALTKEDLNDLALITDFYDESGQSDAARGLLSKLLWACRSFLIK
jgi:hypothetical protein